MSVINRSFVVAVFISLQGIYLISFRSRKARVASSSLQQSVTISEAPSTAPTTSAAVESGIHFEEDVNRQSINLELDLNPVIKSKRQQEEEEEEEEDDDN